MVWLCSLLMCLMLASASAIAASAMNDSSKDANECVRASTACCVAAVCRPSRRQRESNSQPRSHRGAVFKVGSSLSTEVHASLLRAEGCLEGAYEGVQLELGRLCRSKYDRPRSAPARTPCNARIRARHVEIPQLSSLQAASPHAAQALLSLILLHLLPPRTRERCPQQAPSS